MREKRKPAPTPVVDESKSQVGAENVVTFPVATQSDQPMVEQPSIERPPAHCAICGKLRENLKPVEPCALCGKQLEDSP